MIGRPKLVRSTITCKECGEPFPAEKQEDRRQLCHGCNTKRKVRYNRQRYLNNQEATKAKARAYYARTFLERQPKNLVKAARERAVRYGLECTITHLDVRIPTRCPVLGIQINDGSRDSRPSIDRLDNTKGYTKDNIRVISMRANRLKGDATLRELEAVVDYVRRELHGSLQKVG